MASAVLAVTRETQMKTLTVNTPVGLFTRKTNTAYTHIVVRRSPRAMQIFEESKTQKFISSIDKRFAKDSGYAVTYHTSLKAAANAAESRYRWDNETTVIGIYEVAA